jgi:heme/copper-type cytochrome/quinol oxidase subunit 4
VKLGLIVIVMLGILTGIEYVAAHEISPNLIPLVLMAQVKAALILWYFMHIKRVSTSSTEGH